LGRLDALHRAGPSMPRLARAQASIPARDFVLRAKAVEGATLHPLGKETYRVEVRGRPPEYITFDENAADAAAAPPVFMGNAPQLCVPGKRYFERLTQDWTKRAGHRVVDLRPADAENASKAARLWCGSFAGLEFVSAEFTTSKTGFQ